MYKRSVSRFTTRTKGHVFWRQDLVSSLEAQQTTDMAFKIVDRPYPIGEIVRRMVRIKKKCVNAIAHGDDAEHSLLRGEYKYFTGKVIDVRGASVADLIAFIQCCSFFKFFDTNSLDRVLEELQLRINTLQPLEVLALMTATSDLPSKSEGNVDVDEFKQQLDNDDQVRDDVLVSSSQTGSATEKGKGSEPSGFGMSHNEIYSMSKSGLKAGNHSPMPLEIMNSKNFTDYRFRKLAVGSTIGGGVRQIGANEGSDVAAKKAAELDFARANAEFYRHQTISATFFKELSDQALLFMGDGESATTCQYSVEEQLELLATLPEGASQPLVMATLDALAGPLTFYHHHRDNAEINEAQQELYDRGEALNELFAGMPWHAVTVVKGLLLVSLETQAELDASEVALRAMSQDEDAGEGAEYVGRGDQTRGMKRSIEFRRRMAREALLERRQRSESNALFIHRAIEVLGAVIAKVAGLPFTNQVVEVTNDVTEDEDELLSFTRQCSDAIPATDRRKLAQDYSHQQAGGFAGGNGSDLDRRRIQKRTHMLNVWEISSVGASLAHLYSKTAPFVGEEPDLPVYLSKSLQIAYLSQLPQCDVVSLSMMFETCKPVRRSEEDESERYFAAQKQFFSFLRAVEDRIVYHCPKMSLGEATSVLGAYLEAYNAANDVHRSLAEELTVTHDVQLRNKLQKELSTASARMTATSIVIDELVSVCVAHASSVSSGELCAPATIIALLSVLAEHLPHQGESAALPNESSKTFFRKFPKLQPLIHLLGSSVISDSKSYTTDEVLTVLMASVRLGDKILDASVTSCLQRLTRLIELERFAIVDFQKFVPETKLNIPTKSASTAEMAVARRELQRSATIGSSVDADRVILHNARRFSLKSVHEQQLLHAASIVSRNKAQELFTVLESICSHKGSHQPPTPVDKELLPRNLLQGLRPKQIDFIQRMLMPALRKVSLQ